MMNITQKSDIFTFLKTNKDSIYACGVKIGLFGSFVRNAQQTESDIDFLVEFDPEQSNYNNLAHPQIGSSVPVHVYSVL
ncbi:MAG: nucleotidyltransferase domain-containing protein [Anaerolineae bacterium]|nr:nucleotidyltransferase domain-containing protein [Anaerolineae bacterium]